jgi:hypothetical protein
MVAVPIEQQIHGNSQGSNQIPQNQQNSMIINGNVQQLIVHQKTVNPQGPMHAVQQQAQFTGPSGSMNAVWIVCCVI